jgi:hypothetical protein
MSTTTLTGFPPVPPMIAWLRKATKVNLYLSGVWLMFWAGAVSAMGNGVRSWDIYALFYAIPAHVALTVLAFFMCRHRASCISQGLATALLIEQIAPVAAVAGIYLLFFAGLPV